MNKLIHRPRSGFTIVEILIVVAIIGILLSVGLAALTTAQDRGRKTRELNRLRQVLMGWTMYSGQAAEQIMPGFVDEATQLAWRVKYRGRGGQDLDRALSQTYPFRLLPFIDFNADSILGYRDAKENSVDTSLFDPLDNSPSPPASLLAASAMAGAGAALQPGFGYNAFYLGGWWTDSVLEFGDATYQEGLTTQRGKVVMRSTSHLRRPSDIHAFVSSHWQGAGRLQEPFDHLQGWAWIVPSTLAGTQIWFPGGDVLDVMQTQGVPLPRYGGSSTAVGMADGSCKTTSLENLADMRGWIGNASTANFTHTAN